MIFQQIRNATTKIKYGNKIILIDPWLVPKGSMRSCKSPDKKRNEIKNPTVGLPFTKEDIVKDVDICIITHNHIDHFDPDSMSLFSKTIKVFVQNKCDLKIITELGFNDVEILSESGNEFEQITFYKTPGQHGETPITAAGSVSGVILKHMQEKTLYLVGDTIWYDKIKKTIDNFQPEVIVLNAGDARLWTGRVIMNLADINAVYEYVKEYAKPASIIVSHLEAVNHAFVARSEIREFISEHKLSAVYVPDDGEKINFD